MSAIPLIFWAAAQAIQPPLAFPAASFSPPTDPRIQTVVYRTEQVVPLRVSSGYAAVVEFAADERIENVVLGDTAEWQVTPNRAGDRLVVKPLGGATTNMVVLTDVRRYVFLLETSGDPASGAFALRFDYGTATGAGTTAQRPTAADYRLRGDKGLFPTAMTDDGARTAVTWGGATPIPAIFAVDERGRETLVNARMVDGAYLIEGTARRYVLRRGQDRAIASRRPVAARR